MDCVRQFSAYSRLASLVDEEAREKLLRVEAVTLRLAKVTNSIRILRYGIELYKLDL